MATTAEAPPPASPAAAIPRPPVPVVISVAIAAAGAVAALAGALLSFAFGLRAAQTVFGLLWLGAGAAAFAVSSVRRDRWPWGTVLGLSILAAATGVIVAAVGLAQRGTTTAAVAAAVAVAGGVAATAFVRRPTRQWYGYACPGCGAFRWPMQSEAARVPCRACGGPAPVPSVGRALPRWVWIAYYVGWIATSALSRIGDGLAERDRRTALAASHADVEIVGWTGYGGAVASLARASGASPVALEPGTCARSAVPEREGRAFVLGDDLAERILAGSRAHFLAGGVYLFRCERGHASGRRQDVLAVMATTDAREIVRRLGTGAPASGVTSDDVVAFLEALAVDFPLDVTEIGVDYVAARLHDAPADPRALAERILAVAPALRRVTDAEALADDLRRGEALYLWWPDEPAVQGGATR